MKQAKRAITLASALGVGFFINSPTKAAQPSQIDLSSFYAARLSVVAAAEVGYDEGTSKPSAGKPMLVALAGVPEVPSSELRTMRGGFELPGGISVNFGLESSTLLRNQQDAAASVIQSFTVNGTATGSSISGQVTQTTNGVTTNSSLGAGNGPISQLATANDGATSVLTTLGAGGLSTLINNAASNQIIQHTQVLNLDVSGLEQRMSQHGASFSAVSSALMQANRFNHR